MSQSHLTCRIALVAGAAAVVGMGALTACSTDTKEKPAETKSPSQSSAPESPSAATEPTEKKAGPGGNKSFSPTVTARPAPTALPGNVITGG